VRRLANENKVVRAALIAALLLAFGVILYSRVLSGGDEPAPPATAPVTSGSAAEAGSPPVTVPSTAGAPAPTAGVAPALPESTPPVPPKAGALLPGKGLPAPVLKAHAGGKTVALLVIKRRGIDDRRVRSAVEPITRRGDAAVFIVRAKNIARYSRITLGVNVTRVPALIVVSPRDVARKVPRASVSYGFRGTQSAIQAVRDALYEGRNVHYFPE
jgi:hypothetical protein